MNATKKEIETLLRIVKMIVGFCYGTKSHPYTRVDGPHTFVHKSSGKEFELWQVDFEPGVSYFETRWEAFRSYGADKFSEFFRKFEKTFEEEKQEITEKDIFVMIEIIKSAEGFSYGDAIYIHGPYVNELRPDDFYEVINGKGQDRFHLLSECFRFLNFDEEANVVEKFLELKI